MQAQSPKVIFIFVTIFLDAIGLGLLIPVFPDILRRLVAPELVSEYFGYFVGSYALMQFLASPVLGSLSDRFGRRPVLLFSLAGASLDYLLMAFANTLPLIFLGRVISGLTGASMTVAHSYMADISDDSNRPAHFGIIGAAWGVGFIVGPGIGGALSTFSTETPFLVAALLNFLNFLFGFFVLPESLKPNDRRLIVWKDMNPLLSVINVLKPSPYLLLVWIYFLVFLAGQVNPVNWTLYTQTKFHWSARDVGISLVFVGVIVAFSQGFLTKIIVSRIGELKSISIGLFVYATAFVLFGFAAQSWMMYAVLIYFGLSGITVPSLQSQITKQVAKDKQGELQGRLVSLGSLSSVLAPLIFTTVFVQTTTSPSFYFPGSAYVTAGGICFLTLGIWFFMSRQSTP